MQRRKALKLLATGAGSIFVMPAWANGWTSQTINYNATNADFDTLLAEIVDTFIPQSDTPGAKTLGVHQLLQKIATDCYNPAGQEKFNAAVMAVDQQATTQFSKKFVACDATQRLSVLRAMENATVATTADAFKMLKRLTTDGYMKSEYAMDKIMAFEFAPARFIGCVPV